MRRLLLLAAALLVAWPAGPQASVAAAASTQISGLTNYVYDGHHASAEPTDDASERGPRSTLGPITTYDDADRWSRANGPAPLAATTYDHPTQLVQAARATGNTREQARADDGVLSALARNGVAAEDVGLSARGLRPLPGTRVRPEDIPDNWRITGTDPPGGTLYRDPSNPGNSVRVMQGNPSSPYPNSRAPYVRWQRNGQPLDMYGNKLPSKYDPAAHIPLEDFSFMPELFQ